MKKFFTFSQTNFPEKPIRKIWVILIAITSMAYAQNGFSQTIESLEATLSKLEASEAAILQSLVSDTHPSLFFAEGDMKKYGAGDPVCIWSDTKSLDLLTKENDQFAKVQLLRIKIDSAEKMADLRMPGLETLPGLNYLLIVFSYDPCGNKSDSCIPSLIREKIYTPDSGFILTYILSIPE